MPSSDNPPGGLGEARGSEPPLSESSRISGSFLQFLSNERLFLVFVMAGMFVSALSAGTPHVAMWVGFFFASYAAVANDSIQTIGTFIASNRSKPWWALWLFIGGIFLVTVFYSWTTHDGDVSYQRLLSKGYAAAPSESFPASLVKSKMSAESAPSETRRARLSSSIARMKSKRSKSLLLTRRARIPSSDIPRRSAAARAR